MRLESAWRLEIAWKSSLLLLVVLKLTSGSVSQAVVRAGVILPRLTSQFASDILPTFSRFGDLGTQISKMWAFNRGKSGGKRG
jgi:hypothetical protein